MNDRYVKTLWHLLLAGAALVEYRQASSPFRKMVLGACVGWHAAAAHVDWTK